MEKISWLDKVTNGEALRRVNEDRQILISIWQRKRGWVGHNLRHDRLLQEISEGRMRSKPTRGEVFNCYTIWKMMVAILHSNRQLRRGRDEDRQKGCQKLLYSRRLLMMRVRALDSQKLEIFGKQIFFDNDGNGIV